MKSLFFVFIVLSFTCFAQIDSLDRVDTKDGKVFAGKVIKVTSATVQFRESVTNLLHEFNKSEIKDIKLSNGVTVTFDTTPEATDKQNIAGKKADSTQSPNQAVGSSRTQTKTQGEAVGKTQTETKSQAASQNAAPADDGSSKMDTSMIVMLAAGGLVVLLLLGALIF